nr:MAG TPA: hypothetical protein [Caudoviricetes sp.]
MIRCLEPWIMNGECSSSDSNHSINHAYMRC